MIGPGMLQSIEGLAQTAAAAFVSSLWQGILLACVVALCLRFLPKMTASVRFAVWSAVFAVILMLPFLQAWMSRSHATMAGAGAGVRLDVRWSYAIAAVWAALSLWRAGRLALGALRLRRLWKRSTPITGELAAALSSPAAGLRAVELCTSTEIDRPSVIGFFSPRILIPSWLLEKLTPAELEQIIIHEVGHISRADDWINLFQKIGLVLFPLNPALMWIDRRLCFERELACDDGVLESTHAPGAYATCLVSLAEQAKDRRAASLSLGAWERQSELTQRVHSILRRREMMSPLQARLTSGGILLALLGTGLGLSRCPHLVSFTGERPIAELTASLPERALAMPAPAYQPVVFHPSAASHATLLKASLPARSPMKPARAKLHKAPAPRPATVIPAVSPAPAMSRTREASTGMQRFVVLTSAPVDPSGRPGMVLAVSSEHAYAALPTADGWLVIQL